MAEERAIKAAWQALAAPVTEPAAVVTRQPGERRQPRRAAAPVADRIGSTRTAVIRDDDGQAGRHPAHSYGPQAQTRVWLLLFAIVALAAAVRLPNLATNPGWDGDEGYNLNIALNLAQGHRQMFALSFVFVQHPPLFFALAAGLLRLFGPGMLPLRLLAVVLSLATLALLLPVARALVDAGPGAPPAGAGGRPTPWTSGTRLGLLSALVYAALPVVTLQNRFGYTYNGLAFWTVLALLAVARYRRDGGYGALILAGLAGAAALATDQEGIYLLPVLLFGLGGRSPGRRFLACALALAGPALDAGAMLIADPAALLFDITHTAGRVTGGSLIFQVTAWLFSLAHLMMFDPAIPLGFAGLALIPSRSGRRVVLLLLAMMLLVILKVRDPNPLFRTAEPLLPLVCLGLGALAAVLWTRCVMLAQRWLRLIRPSWRPLAVAPALVAVATGAAAGYDARAALTAFHPSIAGALPRSTGEAETMAAWLNERLRPGDLVLAMPQVSWLFHARTAELLQAVAITGRSSAFYPSGIPARRWVYDVHLEAARFLVVDDFTRAWIAANKPERALVERAETTWRRIYVQGEYQVYENPAHRY